MSRPPIQMDGPYRLRRVRRTVLRWLVLALFGALIVIKFGGHAMALIQITGTLVQDAEVRTLPQGPDSTPMPVLVAIFDSDGPGQLPVKAELAYPPNLRPQAQQYAKTLKRGMRVSVTAPIHQIRTTLSHCQAIQPLREPAPDQSQLQLLEAAHG